MHRAQYIGPVPCLLLLLIASPSCGSYDTDREPTGATFSITAPGAGAVTTQHVKVRSLVDGDAIAGSSSTLKRRKDGLTVRVRTRELNAGEPVDVFWAIFNNPGACRNPNSSTGALCTPPDLFIAETGGSLHYVATLTAGADGRLSYSASLSAGSSAGCVGDPFPCSTLTNPAGAEVHSPMFVPNGGPGRQAAQFLPRDMPGRAVF